MRPQHEYRERFRDLLRAERPGSVLDVGCGGGTLLRWLRDAAILAEGLEVEQALVDKLCGRGHVVHRGEAEELPFADGAFDLVVSEYCAHHFADLPRALSELRRVSRRAVWLLDPWYDLSFAAQRLMLRWDEWFKRIDRRSGMVHNTVLSAADFASALPDTTLDRVDFRHWLRPTPVAADWFDEESREHAARATSAEREELAAIRAEMLRDGMTDDGAIVVRIGDQSPSRPPPQ